MEPQRSIETTDSTAPSVPSRRDRREAIRTRALRDLADLAQEAAAHLRRHSSPAIRVSAALLLTGSLAACATGSGTSGESGAVQPSGDGQDGSVSVNPLSEEVAGGLPQSAGTYRVDKDRVYRDQRGVYELTWFDDQNQPHNAYTSKLRLDKGSNPELEIPADGGDPIVRLPEGTGVKIIEESNESRSPSTTYVNHSYPWTSTWLPFAAGALIGRATAPGPAYYNPPTGVYNAGSRIEGGTVSDRPAPPQNRVVGLQSAVSGQQGGTGTGSSVSNKLGRTGSSGSGVAPGGNTTQNGAPTGGRSGQSGGEGSGSAVTGKTGSGSSGSGVTSPSSGGFSSGKGSVGGSSSS